MRDMGCSMGLIGDALKCKTTYELGAKIQGVLLTLLYKKGRPACGLPEV